MTLTLKPYQLVPLAASSASLAVQVIVAERPSALGEIVALSGAPLSENCKYATGSSELAVTTNWTVGVLPALERLASEPLMPNLAISLHATTEDQREALVPVNRKYGLIEILDAARRFPLKRRNRITFEYVLLNGVNDTPEDAHRLVRLLGNIRCKVNLIPLNEAPGIPFTRPSDARVDKFARTLSNQGVIVSVRKSRGRDIRAACGQLIVEGPQKSPAQSAAALL